MADNNIQLRLSIDGAAQASADVARVKDAVGSLNGAVANVAHYAGAFAALAGGMNLSAGAAVRMADAATTLNNQLRLATGSATLAASAYADLFNIAQRGRVSFTELGATYASVARAGAELGISQGRLLKVTESIANAMTISGGSAESMKAALVQLGQGLASGTLRGEELNSVMEQTPRLAQAIAEGMGVSRGELRKLGEQGALTAEQVINALEKSGPQLLREVNSAALTVDQAMILLGNSATKFVGQADAASSASAALADAVQSVSKRIDALGQNQTVLDGLRIAGQAVRVVWSDVAFVFDRVGVELGGIAAQVAAVLRGDFAQAASIARMMTDDARAARAELDKYQAGVLAVRHAQSTDVSIESNETRRLNAGLAAGREAEKLQKRLAELMKDSSNGISDEYIKRWREIGELSAAGVLEGSQLNRAMDAARKLYKPTKPDNTPVKQALAERVALYENAIKDSQAYYKTDQETLAANVKNGIDSASYGAIQGNAIRQKELDDKVAILNREKAEIDRSAIEKKDKASDYQRIASALNEVDRQRSESRAKMQRELNNVDIKAAQERAKVRADEQKSAETAARAIEQAQHAAVHDAIKTAQAAEDETAALKLSVDQHITLAAAVDQLTQARLRDRQAAATEGGNEWIALQAQIEAANRAAQAHVQADTLRKWDETNKRISAGLTDAFIASGKDGGAALRKLLEDELIAKPFQIVVQALLQPVTTAVTQAALGMTGLANGVAGAGSVMSWFPSAAGATSSAMLTANAVQMAGGDGLGALIAGNASGWGVSASGVSSAAAAGGALSSALPYVGAALLANSVLGNPLGKLPVVGGLFGGGGSSAYSTGSGTIRFDAQGGIVGQSDAGGVWGTLTERAVAGIQAIESSYISTAQALGLASPGVHAISWGGNAGAGRADHFAIGATTLGQQTYYSSEQTIAQEPAAMARAVLAQLQHSIASDSAGQAALQKLIGLDAATATIDQINAAIAAAKDLKAQEDALAKQRQGWQDKLDLATGKVTQHELDLRAVTDETTKSLMQQVWAQEDLAAASKTAAQTAQLVSDALGRVSSAAQTVSSAEQALADAQLRAQIDAANATNAAADAMAGYAKTLRDWLAGETQTPGAQFSDTLSAALRGDAVAMQALPGAARDAQDAALQTAASSADYAYQRALVAAGVSQALQVASNAAANRVTVPVGVSDIERATKTLQDAIASLQTSIRDAIKIDLVNKIGEIDLNGNLSVDWAEFKTAFSGMATESTLHSVFTTLDTNGDGQISRLESIKNNTAALITAFNARAVISASGFVSQTGGPLSATDLSGALAGGTATNVSNQVSNALDLNKDGIVTQSEATTANTLANVAIGYAPTITNAPAAGSSNAATGASAELNAVYQELLGRNVDASGAASFAGMSVEQVASAIKASAEYAVRVSKGVAAQNLLNDLVNMQLGLSNATTAHALGAVYSDGLQKFATGGAFTNQIVNHPTLFNPALMGEAGPEAIMPLSRGADGSLGVQVHGGGGADLVGELRALRTEVAALRAESGAENRAIASHTAKTNKILDRVSGGADRLQTVAVTA